MPGNRRYCHCPKRRFTMEFFVNIAFHEMISLAAANDDIYTFEIKNEKEFRRVDDGIPGSKRLGQACDDGDAGSEQEYKEASFSPRSIPISSCQKKRRGEVEQDPLTRLPARRLRDLSYELQDSVLSISRTPGMPIGFKVLEKNSRCHRLQYSYKRSYQ